MNGISVTANGADRSHVERRKLILWKNIRRCASCSARIP